tara:strand:+ start:1200 stop:1523 length:324 start_codon:yes stop_codon:yes gene_type:complete
MPNMKNMLTMTPAERDALARMQMDRGSMIQPVVMMAKAGKELKDIPSDNKGLPNLPVEVRNNMGYKMNGGPNTPPLLPGGMDQYKKRGEVKSMKYYGGGSTYRRKTS